MSSTRCTSTPRSTPTSSSPRSTTCTATTSTAARIVERFDTGERIADELRRRRWLVERNLFMVLRRPRDREAQPGLAREVDAETLQVAEARSVREEPYGKDEEVVRQLVAMRAALARAVPAARFFVGASDGVDAAVTTLYSDGVVAQIEDVATLRDFRRRGSPGRR